MTNNGGPRPETPSPDPALVEDMAPDGIDGSVQKGQELLREALRSRIRGQGVLIWAITLPLDLIALLGVAVAMRLPPAEAAAFVERLLTALLPLAAAVVAFYFGGKSRPG